MLFRDQIVKRQGQKKGHQLEGLCIFYPVMDRSSMDWTSSKVGENWVTLDTSLKITSRLLMDICGK